jgi:hypothetical protein
MKKSNPEFPKCFHCVFADGLVLIKRVSEGGRVVCDCLFDNGSAPRTILASCILLFTAKRRPSAAERKAIRSWKLHESLRIPAVRRSEPDDYASSRSEKEHLAVVEADSEMEEYANVS